MDYCLVTPVSKCCWHQCQLIRYSTSCGIPRRSNMDVNGKPKYSFADTSCILLTPLNVVSVIFIFYASTSPTPTFQSFFFQVSFPDWIHRSSRWAWHLGWGIGYLGRHKAFSQQFAFLHAFEVLVVLSLAFRHHFLFFFSRKTV